jgi:hypothetical protein
VSADPCAIDLQSKVAREKELRSIRIGDRVELAHDLREAGGYIALRENHVANRLAVLEPWSCPNCGSNLWAEVVFENEVLTSVRHVDLTEQVLSAADFISSEALMFFPMDETLEVKKLAPGKFAGALLEASKDKA